MHAVAFWYDLVCYRFMNVVSPETVRQYPTERVHQTTPIATHVHTQPTTGVASRAIDVLAPLTHLAPETNTMHRYAGHNAPGLARALHRMRRNRPANTDVNLPDVWGNTLLHTACASAGAGRQVAMLLKAGAHVNAVGPYGMTPLASALMARQWPAARRVQDAGGALNLGPFNEASERSFLANIFGIDGVTYLHGKALELEGAFDFGAYPRLAEAVEAFARACADPRAWSATMWSQGARALREAPSNNYLPCAEVRAKARAGVALLLPTGWRGHSVCMTILGARAVRANRNRSPAWLGHKPLQALQFKNGSPSSKQLTRMRNNRNRAPWLGKAVLWWLDATHGMGRHRAFARSCAHLAPSPQKAHNCTVANAKAGLLALLMLLRAQDGITEDATTYALLQLEYKRLTTFIRLYFLESYRAMHAAASSVARDPPDTVLMLRCETKLMASAKRRHLIAALRSACMHAAKRC